MAVEAAEELGHSYVGTEHLLIGLLREKSGVAARVLEDCGVRVEKVTELINQLIAPNQRLAWQSAAPTRPALPGYWKTATVKQCGLKRR